MSDTIKRLTIEGFKSTRKLEEFELRSLNVLIGANGAGKSNFVGFFRLLRELIDQRLQLALATEGGADTCLYLGPKVTQRIVAKLYFGENGYEFVLVPTVDNRLVFAEEVAVFKRGRGTFRDFLGSGHAEAKIKDRKDEPGRGGGKYGVPHYVYKALSSWVVYHFHDTSPTAGVRRQGPINDNEILRPNAENLAAFLYRIRHTNQASYEKIRDVVRLAAPFFDDFKLRPVPTTPDLIQLEWLQQDSDYPFLASQLSDGTLRFVCLATALLQPARPPTVLFDEPELGLHPYALTLLGSLLQQATEHSGKQVIVSTQSAALLNEFSPEDVIVVERSEGQSVFRRLDPADLIEWLEEEYTLGELWQKNVLGGRPQKEGAPDLVNGNREAPMPAPEGGPSAGDGRS
ncbi:MAG: AAA family ATPase [Bryobacteraceae bacterium]|jgi:predicted ATPase